MVIRQADISAQEVMARREQVVTLLRVFGFEKWAGRVEFKLPLEQALAHLSELPDPNGAGMARGG